MFGAVRLDGQKETAVARLRFASVPRQAGTGGMTNSFTPMTSHEKSIKSQTLSEAPHRFIALHSACGAESKDPGGAYLTYAAGSFPTTDVVARHSKMLASSWFSAPEKTVVEPRGAGSEVESSEQPRQDKDPRGSFGSAPQALCQAVNRCGATLPRQAWAGRMKILWENR